MKKLVRKIKTDLIIPIFVVILILILAISLIIKKPIFLAPGELSVERMLPSSANLNEQFEVTLNIYTGTDKPAALGITEIIPQGWLISSVSGADYKKINEDNVEILIFDLMGNIQDTVITYTITPTSQQASFSGNWKSVGPGEQDYSGNIEGDSSLIINTGGDGSDGGGGGGSGGGSGGGGGGSDSGGGSGAITPTQPRTQTCKENWLCSAWSKCENERKTRTCTDTNLCGTILIKPLESSSCNLVVAAAEQATDYSSRHTTQRILILLIAIIIVIVAIIVIIRKRKLRKIKRKIR